VPVWTHPLAYVLNEAYNLVRERIGSKAAILWINAPNPDLGGRTPVEALKDGKKDMVLRVAKDAS
jgi:hypothetical protein